MTLAHVILYLCYGWLVILSLRGPWWHTLVTCVAMLSIYICSGIIFDYYRLERTKGAINEPAARSLPGYTRKDT